MPAIRPEAVSNAIRLAYEFRALMWAFVSEHGAVDTLLAAVVDELSPGEHGIRLLCSQDNLFSWANELRAPSPIGVAVATVVALVEFETVTVAVLGQPPEWAHLPTHTSGAPSHRSALR